MITFVAAEGENQNRFLGVEDIDTFMKDVEKNISEESLRSTLEYGIGFIHDGLTDREIKFLKTIYKQGLIRVLVVIYTLSWRIDDLQSHIVIILDAERYDGVEQRYTEYSIPDML